MGQRRSLRQARLRLAAQREVEALLGRYSAKGVPRIHAIRAGIRSLETSGAARAKRGKYCLEALRELLKKEEASRKTR